MTSKAALTSFLEARQSRLTSAFESGNVDKILTFYDPDLSFSDHGTSNIRISRPNQEQHQASRSHSTLR